jgi:flagellar biosynthetic protein FliR
MIMDVQAAWVISVFLMCLRFGALIIVGPIFSGISGFITVRVLFTIAISVALVAGLPFNPTNVPMTLGPLLVAACAEVFVGATMAFGVMAAFAAFSIAGKILDIQSGLGIGSVFDPIERAGAALSATMLNLVGMAVFFGMQGHHALMRGVAFSVAQIPPGASFSALSAETVIRQFGLSFSLGVTLIAPVIFCLFLVETALSVLARVLPQMNVFVVGVPVKIFAGIAMLALTMESTAPVMGRIYASIFTYWEQVLV